MKERCCLRCREPLTGRLDKKFCSDSCKSAYHYELSLELEESFYKTVDRQLKANRRILKQFNKAGKATVKKQALLDQGFNPKYFTHYWKAKNGNLYLFCYEFGFMKKNENGREKYVLVHWQDYMDQTRGHAKKGSHV